VPAAHLIPSDIAKQFRVKRAKVLAWIASGQLSAFDVSDKPGGRPRWRVRQEDLDAFLAGRSNRATVQTKPRRRSAPLIEFF
jgi:Helix-turn-helix domain